MNQQWEIFSEYTEEELAADEYFQQWVLLPDCESHLFWNLFSQAHPGQRITIQNARKLVQHLTDKGFHIPLLSKDEKQALKASIYEQLALGDPVDQSVKKFPSSRWKWTTLAAAVFALLFFLKISFFSNTQHSPLFAIQTTALRQVKEILLPDSSVIILNGNSSVRYNTDFNAAKTREVFLEGNAYFKVKKTAAHTAFIVHTKEVNILVTGTEFNVNARTRATGVVLTSGKVNVTMQADVNNTASMEAGYKLNVDTLHHLLITNKTNTQLYTAAWKQREWHFQETTLETIAALIKEYYGVEVTFSNETAKKLMITAVVSVHDFSTLINVIERTLNVSIKVENQQLIIQ